MHTDGDFIIGIRRRKIEDQIIGKYQEVNFDQENYQWLDEKTFWDYIFSWFELSRYYGETRDTAIGARMLELYTMSVRKLQNIAQNRKIHENRRNQATQALAQITYFVDQIMVEVHKNTLPDEDDYSGRIAWHN